MPYWVFLIKNALFGYFGARIFKKTINTLQFVYLQNFAKKQKCLNLGPMPYLGNFGLEF